jgi:hypothetical protein
MRSSKPISQNICEAITPAARVQRMLRDLEIDGFTAFG